MNNKKEKKLELCVHTEHCCVVHGCKYGEEESCPVWLGWKPQSFPCEDCSCDAYAKQGRDYYDMYDDGPYIKPNLEEIRDSITQDTLLLRKAYSDDYFDRN